MSTAFEVFQLILLGCASAIAVMVAVCAGNAFYHALRDK